VRVGGENLGGLGEAGLATCLARRVVTLIDGRIHHYTARGVQRSLVGAVGGQVAGSVGAVWEDAVRG